MAANEIVISFVNLSYIALSRKEDDHVYAYGKEVLSLGLLLMEFCDTIWQGDGLRILCGSPSLSSRHLAELTTPLKL